jgi:putative ABC transport system substrate-binding protein
VQDAAERLGLSIRLLDVRVTSDLRVALETAVHEQMEALLVVQTPLMRINRVEIISFAAGRLPVVYAERAFVDSGGLMSYGPDRPALTIAPPSSSTESSREANQAIYQSSSRRNSSL